MSRYQRATYDPKQREWTPTPNDTGTTIGECVKLCLTSPDKLPEAGILILDNAVNDWVAHVLPDPDGDGSPMVAYNPEHVRVTRISGNN